MIRIGELSKSLDGDVYTDLLNKILYSTDSSVYRERPAGIARPKNSSDIKKIIRFCIENKLSIIPRAAGTSLAGQVVGAGLVVDIKRHLNKILEFNKEEKWVKVEPGVVLDELNLYLAKEGLFFSPETSTSNRCTLGGMTGNNSCGSHSLIYGSTRDHILEIECILSDCSQVVFKKINENEFEEKCSRDDLEGNIYNQIFRIFSEPDNRNEIIENYPEKAIRRRNNGYAIDELADFKLFGGNSEFINLSKLIAGSEGTICFITSLKLNLSPLPANNKSAVVVHFNKFEEVFDTNLIALEYKPDAIELIDDKILEASKSNLEQIKNRSFIEQDPKAVIVVEFTNESNEKLNEIVLDFIEELKIKGFGYSYPVLKGPEINKVWNLRKAGLGLLSNIPGDARAEAFIEDTAINPLKLKDFIAEYTVILKKYDLDCVFYGHIATGALHLRPMLNLKLEADRNKFRAVTSEVAHLVKKYKGSLSGEHGDGRLRGEFIPVIIGEKNFEFCKSLKQTWDPENIFNPGKIINTPKMNDSLRYDIAGIRNLKTYFNFNNVKGIQRAAEKCNGSGDCLKSELFTGTMCPSYKATKDEKDSPRARANVLREFITRSEKPNPFNNKEILEVMDLCLSCKACKSECPSSVDIAKLKAEFLQQYYSENGYPFRSRIITLVSKINKLGSILPAISNLFIKSKILNSLLGFTGKRVFPLISDVSLFRWYKENKTMHSKKVYFFADEFTSYTESEIGITAIKLLEKLGYKVEIPKQIESGRAYISKGFLKKAKIIAENNIKMLSPLLSKESPLIGIEPSAVLTFRDECPDLVGNEMIQNAQKVASNTLLIEEFLLKEFENGRLDESYFTDKPAVIKVHGHCQQKSVSSIDPILKILSLPKNYKVSEIKSGCCGMAGSFGYEKEHYDISIKIGEQILFPAVRDMKDNEILCASGTSCRHQIKDGTGAAAKHPVEILYEALNK